MKSKVNNNNNNNNNRGLQQRQTAGVSKQAWDEDIYNPKKIIKLSSRKICIIMLKGKKTEVTVICFREL
jgi:hypothetical protein